jgi:hypothetical protein
MNRPHPYLAVVTVLAIFLSGSAGYRRAAAKAAPRRHTSTISVRPRSTSAFTGVGTWVDVYDYSPRFQDSGKVPAITPASVDLMAAQGIRTLYIEAAVESPRGSGLIDPSIVRAFIARAHRHGMKVVSWYPPTFASVSRDLARVKAIAALGVDAVGLDLERTHDVPDTTRRNAALVDLSRRARRATNLPVAAIVPPPTLLDRISWGFWPSFPWKSIRSSYDVWLPMAYWTDRTTKSGWRDAGRYTSDNLALLRSHLGKVPVHVIGGIGGSSTGAQYRSFAATARAGGAIGVSIYDFHSTGAAVWPILTAAWQTKL